MRAATLALVLVLGTLGAPGALGAPSANPSEEVRATLDAQVVAWNRGDLPGYMLGYWHSEELTFFSNASVTRGWQATLDRYRARYQGPQQEMGVLRFEGLEVVVLGPDAAVARGAFVLRLRAGERRGLFTVILRRLPEGWRIVHDHSSL